MSDVSLKDAQTKSLCYEETQTNSLCYERGCLIREPLAILRLSKL